MTEKLPEGVNQKVAVGDLGIDFEAVDPADTVAGQPEQGSVDLGALAGADVGVWELRGGTVTDTEADEFFVVVSGGATIEILEGPNAGETLTVTAGDAARLVAGTKTRWTVSDHIRKVYIMDGSASS